jgi:preprotein translocase subunit SecF
VGTYSSVYIASPVLIWFGGKASSEGRLPKGAGATIGRTGPAHGHA